MSSAFHPHKSHWESEMKLHPDKPQLWLAMIKAFFPIQLPMYLPFAIVTTCKIVQAHVGIKGLIHVLDRGGPAREVSCRVSRVSGKQHLCLFLPHSSTVGLRVRRCNRVYGLDHAHASPPGKYYSCYTMLFMLRSFLPRRVGVLVSSVGLPPHPTFAICLNTPKSLTI